MQSIARKSAGVLVCFAVLLALGACGKTVRLASRATWFTVTSAGRIAVKTVEVGVGVARTGVSTTADVLTGKQNRAIAVSASDELVRTFWFFVRRQEYGKAYSMLSPQLKGLISRAEFQTQSESFAPEISKYKVRQPKVSERWVSVPSDLLVEVKDRPLLVRATATVVRLNGNWYIDGWKVQDGSRIPESRELEGPAPGDEAPEQQVQDTMPA